jgi:hypothetical protein
VPRDDKQKKLQKLYCIRNHLYLTTHEVCFSDIVSSIPQDIIGRNYVEEKVRKGITEEISLTDHLDSREVWESSLGSRRIGEVCL